MRSRLFYVSVCLPACLYVSSYTYEIAILTLCLFLCLIDIIICIHLFRMICYAPALRVGGH